MSNDHFLLDILLLPLNHINICSACSTLLYVLGVIALCDSSRSGVEGVVHDAEDGHQAAHRHEHVDLLLLEDAPQPGGDDPESLEIMRQLIINMDPPNHVKYRRVVRNAFTGKAVDALEPLMREFAKDIIDNVASRGECEFVSEVSAEMPLFIISALKLFFA